MTAHPVYLDLPRFDAALLARALKAPVSDLHEVVGPELRGAATMSERMRPLALGIRMAGNALTVQPGAGDNLMMHRALKMAQRGDVLVIAAGGVLAAQWGTLAALYAERIGLAGVVVDGSIRDVDELAHMRYPVWATAISPMHPDKQAAGSINVPVRCDGVTVNPGDLVVGDGDGVIVVPRARAEQAVAAVEHRVAEEALAARRIAAGETLWEVHDLGAAYARLGLAEQAGRWSQDAKD
ncbi:MAG TPA: RraA family protein [Burkholderiales bacterium]